MQPRATAIAVGFTPSSADLRFKVRGLWGCSRHEPRPYRTGRATRPSDRGVALILVMLALLVLSVLTAAIIFTARAETFASYNYKRDTQADYLAKAGIQQAVEWFRSARYTAVAQADVSTYYNVGSSGNPLYLFTSNDSPVKCISGCVNNATGTNQVQLIGFTTTSSNSPYGSGSSNYPNTGAYSSVISTFNHDLVNVQVTGDTGNSGTFSINALLLSYQTVNTGTPPTVQNLPMETWLITSHATWNASSSSAAVVATAEEQAVIQPVYTSSTGNALYGYCSVSMSGSSGVCTDSYNSALGAYGGGSNSTASGACGTSATNVIDTGAGVGANGYVSLSSNVTVNGNVTIGTSPTGGSSCCSGTHCGFQGSTSSVNGQVVSGPYINPPTTPSFPGSGQASVTFPGTSPSYSSTQTLPQISSSNSGTPSGTHTLTNGSDGTQSYGYPCISTTTCNGTAANPYLINGVSLSGSKTLTLYGGPSVTSPVYYDLHSVSMAGQSQLAINGYVVLNVESSLSLTGKGIVNGLTEEPSAVQINYAGTSTVSIGGNGAMSAIVTAPNAEVDLGGGGSSGYMIGAIKANNVVVKGGYPIHYDVQLSRLGGSMGTVQVTSYMRRKL